MVENKDPWIHRSEGMKCRTCMWYVPKIAVRIAGTNETVDLSETVRPGSKVGRCRRYAPTMNGYPVCFDEDWCGDHKLDETKI